jgi:hypothetical protein
MLCHLQVLVMTHYPSSELLTLLCTACCNMSPCSRILAVVFLLCSAAGKDLTHTICCDVLW